MHRASDVEIVICQTVAENIAQYRKKSGMTQRQVGDALGLEKETVSRIESGKISVNIERLSQLSMLFHCSIHDFLIKEESVTKYKIENMIYMLDSIDDSQRDIALSLMQNIAKTFVDVRYKAF